MVLLEEGGLRITAMLVVVRSNGNPVDRVHIHIHGG